VEMSRICIVTAALLALSGRWAGAAGQSLLRPGDRWVMDGDSITHNDTYRRAVVLVQKHFHPTEPVAITQVGVTGATSAHGVEGALSEKPTVVSIMLGVNNYINSSFRYGMDIKPFVESYRADIEKKVRAYREGGAVVLLLSPPLTDERFDHGIYELRGSREFLKECAKVLQEIAKSCEGVFYVPVQEEFEAFQQSLADGQILRCDGVHPSALGQYRIARTLWEHLNLAGDMRGDRRELCGGSAAEPAPVRVSLASRFMADERAGLSFVLKSEKSARLTATWSLGQARGQQALDVPAGETVWKPEIPQEALRLEPGESAAMVLDLADGARRSVFIVDLFRVRVLHLTDGKVSGTVESRVERPEGRKVADWTVEWHGTNLFVHGETFDSDIESGEFWPWARDGVNFWFDFRPTERFADIGLDEEVHMAILQVADMPAFSATLIPWLGRGMHLAADAGAVRTPSGYKWHLNVSRYFTKSRRVDFSGREFIGFNLIVPDLDIIEGKPVTTYHLAWDPREPTDKRPDSLMILDLRNRFAGDFITNVHIFGW